MDLLKKYGSKGINKHTTRIYGGNGRYAGIDKNHDVYNEPTGMPGMYYCFEVKDPEEYSHGEGVETIWYGTLQEARAVVEDYIEGRTAHIPQKCFRDRQCQESISGRKRPLNCMVCQHDKATAGEAV